MSDLNTNLIFTAVDHVSNGVAAIDRRLHGLEGTVGRIDRGVGLLGRGFGKFNAILQGIGLGVGIGSFFAIERAIGRVIRIIPDLIGRGEQWAATVDDISDRTGLAAKEASTLAAAAKYVNVNTDSLIIGLTRLATNVETNESLFKKFGIATRDTNGNMLSAWQLFQNVRQASTATGASFLSTAAAQKLLGRGGAELLDLLHLTDEQFNAISADAQRSGLIMSDAASAAAEEWERTKSRLDSAITGIGVQVLGGVAPYLSLLIDGITNAIQQNMDKIVTFVVQVVNFLGGLVAGFFGITIPTISFAHALGTVGGNAKDAGKGLDAFGNNLDSTTSKLDKQIAAIDRELRALDKQSRAHDAARQRTEMLGEISDLQAQLQDLQSEAVFTAGMSAAEAELARQAQAAKIIDAAKAVQDAKDRLAEHDHDQEVARRRQELQDERAALEERKRARARASGTGLRTKPGKPAVSEDDRGGLFSHLDAAITKAGEDARAAGALLGQNIKDLGPKIGAFLTGAGHLIDTISPLIPLITAALVANKFGLLPRLGGRGPGGPGVFPVAPTANPIGPRGVVARQFLTDPLALPMLLAGTTPGNGSEPARQVVGDLTKGNAIGEITWQISHALADLTNSPFDAGPGKGLSTLPKGVVASALPASAFASPDAQDRSRSATQTTLEQIARNTGVDGTLGRGLGDLGDGTDRTANAAEDTSDNTSSTALNTEGTWNKLIAGINADAVVKNQPNVNVANTPGVTLPTAVQRNVANIVTNTDPLTKWKQYQGKLTTDSIHEGTPSAACFVAGTPVASPAGDKYIELIAVGDVVLAYSADSGLTPRLVTQVHHHLEHVEPRVRVTLEDGREIHSTAAHPFYDPTSATYKSISEFRVGSVVGQPEELGWRMVAIASIEDLGSEPTDVFNITVDIDHNYLVAGGILVHNTKPAAMGLLGMSNMATDVTFGEAGREAVAILRRPRSGRLSDLGGGGGSGPSRVTERGQIVVPLEIDKKVIGQVALDYIVRDGRLSTTSIPN